jgi:hypothetical protein
MTEQELQERVAAVMKAQAELEAAQAALYGPVRSAFEAVDAETAAIEKEIAALRDTRGVVTEFRARKLYDLKPVRLYPAQLRGIPDDKYVAATLRELRSHELRRDSRRAQLDKIKTLIAQKKGGL